MSEDAIFISVLAVLFLPLASTFITSLVSIRYQWIAPIVSTFLLLLTVVFTLIVFYNCWNQEQHVWQNTWFMLDNQPVTVGVFLNNTSLVMLLIISLISLLVHIFSVGYMAGDSAEQRYFSMLGFFTFAMLGLVLADNLLLLFVFWELVGFSSYILIGHWREKPKAASAAKKAFLINRIGDLGLLVGLLLVWTNTGSFNLTLFSFSGEEFWQTAASLSILIGVIGKSAQFPLFIWLPDAMEGPTPVSALVHAATMVAAGVFLLIRVFPIFTPGILDLMVIIGSITSLLGALAALRQTDFKKILAYSTISQLGLMVAAVGTGAYGVALLHLFTHAFFKAGLFLCAGSVIHSVKQAQYKNRLSFDAQNIRHLGGLHNVMPVTFTCFAICSAALIGFPLLSGFQSKDGILISLFQWSHMGNWKIAFSCLVAFSYVLTVFYTVRMLWFVFLAPAKKTQILSAEEAPFVMRLPIILLSIASLWPIVSLHPLAFSGWLLEGIQYPIKNNLFITWFSLIAIPVFVILAWLWYRRRELPQLDQQRFELLLNAFYINKLFTEVIAKPVLKLSWAAEKIDRQVIDGTIHIFTYAQVAFAHFIGWVDSTIVDGAVHNTGRVAKLTGSVGRSFSGGKIQMYIFWSVFALIIFLFWVLF